AARIGRLCAAPARRPAVAPPGPWRAFECRHPAAGGPPPRLPGGASWMQGAAGVAPLLLRLARVMEDGLSAPVVDRPDQWWAVPAELRTVHTGPEASPGPA